MRWKLKKKNWSKITWVAKKKKKKRKKKRNNELQIKKTGLQIKIMKETKKLEIGTRKKHVTKILLA